MPLNCKQPSDIILAIQDNDISFVDFKFSDIFGQLKHITLPSKRINITTFKDGIILDGSLIGRGKEELLLVPLVDTAFLDPFSSSQTLSLVCDIINPVTKQNYDLDPRYIAQKSLQLLQETQIGDTVNISCQPEFFILDNISNLIVDKLNSNQINLQNNDNFNCPQQANIHISSLDKNEDIRLEIISILESLGIEVTKAYQKSSSGQTIIDFKPDQLLKQADFTQLYKYVVRNVANSYGKWATFLPKPSNQKESSNMYCNLSIYKEGQNIFFKKDTGLSQTGLWAIGGIMKHSSALAAITNPTLNSYHRLYNSSLNFDQANNEVIQIPIIKVENEAEIKCLFPDGSGNPYLTFAAILCACVDGIISQINPQRESKLERNSSLPTSLNQALTALKADNQFLIKNGVFTQEFLDVWISTKQAEIEAVRLIPHPKEFEIYHNI